jgi:hypothetical protein
VKRRLHHPALVSPTFSVARIKTIAEDRPQILYLSRPTEALRVVNQDRLHVGRISKQKNPLTQNSKLDDISVSFYRVGEELNWVFVQLQGNPNPWQSAKHRYRLGWLDLGVDRRCM